MDSLNHSSSPGGTCLALSGGATDVIVGPNNSLTSCGTFTINTGNSFYYIQGNTFAYAGCVPPNPISSCGRAWIADWESCSSSENNDFSHYQLGKCGTFRALITSGATILSMTSSNLRPDQWPQDSIFWSPLFDRVTNVLMREIIDRNAVGPNAKGFLVTERCLLWFLHMGKFMSGSTCSPRLGRHNHQ